MFVHDLIVSVAGALSPITPLLPYYHLVSDERLAHVCHLHPCKTERQFVDDLDFLCRHYRPVAVSDLVDHARHGKRLVKKSFLLTFDDGYRQIHSVVAPILVRKGVPAIFFLASGFIGNERLGFRNTASLVVEHLIRDPDSSARLESRIRGLLPAGPGVLAARILAVSYKDAARLDQIAAFLEIDIQDYLRTERPYLTRPEVGQLAGMGFSIGAHSVDHPLFQSLPLPEQLRQAKESLMSIREAFAPAYALFAFPHSDLGISEEFFRAIDSEIDLSFGTSGIMRDPIATNLQRINFERSLRPASSILARQHVRKILRGRSKKMLIRRTPAELHPGRGPEASS